MGESTLDDYNSLAYCVILGANPILPKPDWGQDCAEHGTNSKWWNSAEQVLKREVDSTRLRDLQQKAKEARLKAKNIDNV